MDNQHRKITGYRELSQEEIDLMNEIKALGVKLQEICDKVDSHVALAFAKVDVFSQDEAARNELNRLEVADPESWSKVGRKQLQAGLMFLTRAVAQPTFF